METTNKNSMIGKIIPEQVYRICAATKKERKLSAKLGRSSLAGVHVTKERVEYTNGHFLVTAPNPIAKEDTVTGIFETFSKSKATGDFMVAGEIAEGKTLTTISGNVVGRIDGDFPDTQVVRETQVKNSRKITFNAEYLRMIAECFDLGEHNGITLEIGGENDPIRVAPAGDDSQGYAVLMPIKS